MQLLCLRYYTIGGRRGGGWFVARYELQEALTVSTKVRVG
jgi:hypothetical protein